MSRFPVPRRAWLIAGGGLLLVAGLAWATWPSAPSADPPKEAAPAAAAIEPRPTPPAASPARPPASAAGLVLFGVLGGGDGAAVIGTADGRQRLVRVGLEVVPGVRLTGIEQYAALLSDGTRLSLSDVSGRDAPPARQAAARPTDVTVLTQDRNAEETRAFRLGLAPVEKDGRTTGFAVRPDIDMPILKKGGIQPGDVITTINGRAFDKQAEVDQLAREISLSPTLVLEIERNGVVQEVGIDTRQ